MRLGMSMMSMTWGITCMEVLLERMSGERGGTWSFRYLFLSFSLFLFWSPQSHSHFGRPQLLTNEQKPPIELPARSPNPPPAAHSLLSFGLYDEYGIALSRLFGSDQPTPTDTTTSAFSHLFSIHFLPVSYYIDITTHFNLLPLPTWFLTQRRRF